LLDAAFFPHLVQCLTGNEVPAAYALDDEISPGSLGAQGCGPDRATKYNPARFLKRQGLVIPDFHRRPAHQRSSV
jgi:hypothetical protein